LKPVQASLSGTQGSAFVTKVNAAGTALVYSTYLGGTGSHPQWGRGIAVDGSGNAVITGYTASSDFPTRLPLQATWAGFDDAFVAKFISAGALRYSTYLGGSSSDLGFGIAVDTVGNAYVTGGADSSDFPMAAAFQAFLKGPDDAFVVKIADPPASVPASRWPFMAAAGFLLAALGTARTRRRRVGGE
jgi:hypothetical protein